MSFKQLSTTIIAITLGTYSFASQADNGGNYNWVPKQPTDNYWQAPNWSGFSAPPPSAPRPSAPPSNVPPPYYNNNYQRPTPPPQAYRQPPAYYPQNMNRGAMPPPPTGPYNNARPMPSRMAPPMAPSRQQGPNNRPAPPYNPYYNNPSAFNTPGYNAYNRGNNDQNNGWNNNRFWGRSGPNTWMNPNKQNWENSWDDMINAPSRMGEMPGGWTAPEVTVPNPIDMGDQFQDNVKDLPEQMRDMNVGNDVKN